MVPRAGRPAAPREAAWGERGGRQRVCPEVWARPRLRGPGRPGRSAVLGPAPACSLHGAAVPRTVLLPGQQPALLGADGLASLSLWPACDLPAGLFPGTCRSGHSAAQACFGARPGRPEFGKILRLDSWRLVTPFALTQLAFTEYLLCARCGIRKCITGVRTCRSGLPETQVH